MCSVQTPKGSLMQASPATMQLTSEKGISGLPSDGKLQLMQAGDSARTWPQLVRTVFAK